MALLNDDIERKTMAQFKSWPGHKELKQSNTKLPGSLIDSLDALARDSGETKQDLIALALFDFVSSKDYLNKKLGSVEV